MCSGACPLVRHGDEFRGDVCLADRGFLMRGGRTMVGRAFICRF